jgi:hypothetical protein
MPRFIACAIAGLLTLAAAGPVDVAAQAKKKPGPETFNAKASVGSEAGRGDAYVTIRIDQWTPEKSIQAMEKALKDGGSAGFVTELRRAPLAGRFEAGQQALSIRWARQRDTATGRVISVVVDKPVYFVGAGVPGAKSKEGYDVAVIQLVMDSSGVGEGTIAAAARVKPGGPDGVEIDAYETSPVKLLSVMKLIK